VTLDLSTMLIIINAIVLEHSGVIKNSFLLQAFTLIPFSLCLIVALLCIRRVFIRVFPSVVLKHLKFTFHVVEVSSKFEGLKFLFDSSKWENIFGADIDLFRADL